MNEKSAALLLSLFVLMVFITLSGATLVRAVNEGNLVRRYIMSTRAFWAAEAGAAVAKMQLRNCVINGSCTVTGSIAYTNDVYSYTASITDRGNAYYQIQSNAVKADVSRKISNVVKLRTVNASNFPYAVESQGALDIGGSAQVNPPTSVHPNATLNFKQLFGVPQEVVKASADYSYVDPPNNTMPCQGVTWVKVSEGQVFRITSSGWQGSGILVIEGHAKITGGTFNGIIYVIGGDVEVPLEAVGNPVINGAVLIQGDPSGTVRMRGNVTVNYNVDKISDGLNTLRFIAPPLVAWWEEPAT